MTNVGQLGPNDLNSSFNRLWSVVRQCLGSTRTVVPVEVTEVTSSGQVAPAGFVKVKPLVNLLDGDGNSSEHGVINNLPYFRYYAGGNAIILDPQVGDLGLALISDRDISALKQTKARANPGSLRRFSLADGIYLGGFLDREAPEQYIRFYAGGVEIADKNGNIISMEAGKIKMTTTLLEVTGEVVAKSTSTNVHVSTHTHPTAPDGPVSPPTPGS